MRGDMGYLGGLGGAGGGLGGGLGGCLGGWGCLGGLEGWGEAPTRGCMGILGLEMPCARVYGET